MSDTDDYIDLDRVFIEIDPDRHDLDEVRELISYGGAVWAGLSWTALWQSQAVVILAEAGAGKTTELRAQTAKLKAEGRAAFFIPIEQLASSPLREALAIGDETQFEAWLSSREMGYFLLDSVDETRLVDKNFEAALKALVRGVGPALLRTRLAITCRINDWRWHIDQDAVVSVLPKIPVHPRAVVELGPSDAGLLAPIFAEDTADGRIEDEGGEKTAPAYRLVALAPLNAEQWRRFARARHIDRLEEFVEAIRKSSAEDSASRPLDLQRLMEFWQARGALGTLSERLTYDAARRLTEINPAYQAKHQLTQERAESGTEVLAAALTLCKLRSIRLPGSATDRKVRGDSLEPGRVLDDWTDPEIGALLHRSMFHGTSYGCVGIHHRHMQSYFAARFLLHLNQMALSNRRLHEILFGGSPNALVLRPSAASIAGWLALRKPEIFQVLLTVSPETLIEQGDPQQLTDPQVEAVIEAFCTKYEGRSDTGLQLYREQAVRLARPSLGGLVRHLWRTHASFDDQRHLLLRMIEHGPMPDCADLGLGVALDAQYPILSRQHAIYAVSRAGTPEQQTELLKTMLVGAHSLNPRLSGCLIETYYPRVLSIEDLDVLVAAAPPADAGVWLHDLRHVLEDLAPRLSTESTGFLLGRWLPLLEQEPHTSRHPRISRRYQWLLKTVACLCEKMLSARQTSIDEVTASAIELVTQARAHQIDYHLHSAPNLGAMIAANPHLNEYFFWRAVRRASERAGEPVSDWWSALQFGSSWSLGEKDIDWLMEGIAEAPTHADQQVALTAVFALRSHWERDERQTRRFRARAAAAGLKDALDSLYDDASQSTRLSRMDERYRRKQLRDRAKAEQSWRDFRDRFANNPALLSDPARAATVEGFWERYNFVKWLQAKEASNDSWGVKDWRLLREGFPETVVQAARDAIVEYWPRYTPALESEKENPNEHSLHLDLGLSGINFLAIQNPEWTRSLSKRKAETAIRYALNERSYFPFWADALFETHSALAIEIVTGQIDWDFAQAPASVHHFAVLDTFRHGDLRTTERFMPALIGRLQESDPASPRALEYCLERLMRTEAEPPAGLAILALERADRARADNAPDHAALWLSIGLCRTPAETIWMLRAWLEAAPSEGRSELFVSVMAALFDHDGPRYPAHRMGCLRHPDLAALAALVYEQVPTSGDRVHDKPYSPNRRDSAERARRYLSDKIVATPGDASVVALKQLANIIDSPAGREHMLRLADERRRENAEREAMSVEDFRVLKRRGELIPDNRNDFFTLVVDKVRDVKAYLEGGDDQQKIIVRREQDEHLVQIKMMQELERFANGLYQVYREIEVGERKSPDFIVSSNRIAAEVVIEAKVGDNRYSAVTLTRFIADQLIGKYLRNPTRRVHGILLVTWHGRQQYWRHPQSKRRMTFSELMDFLQAEATDRSASLQSQAVIEVIGIDLTDRAS